MEIDQAAEQQPAKLSAQRLSWILIATLILLVVGLFVGTWYTGTILKSRVDTVRQTDTEAQTNVANLARAQALAIYAERNEAEMDKAASIVAETKLYQHQNQIVRDVTGFADQAGVTVLGFDFPKTTGTAQTKTASGLRSVSATVLLENPVRYTDFLTFIKLIERNLTRMQITTVQISADQNRIGYITTPTIGLEVYVK